MKELTCGFVCRKLLESRGNGVPGWHLYFLCGALGVLEQLEGSLKSELVSLDVCVDGRVPPRAGLSSSSALVCAAALTTLVANEVGLSILKSYHVSSLTGCACSEYAYEYANVCCV